MSERLSLLQEVKAAANGMLPIEVYDRIFELGRLSTGGTFVEVGTAHGAATLCLALGARQQDRPFHVYTVDPFSGQFSSRSQYGTVQDNVAYVRTQFARFGVGDHVTIVPGSVEDLKRDHPLDRIDLLMLDADGRIDRELAALFHRLADGCPIVIDDVDDWVGLSRVGGFSFFDQKHKISHLLVDIFSGMDLIRKDGQVVGTGFFRKGQSSAGPEDILLAALSAYRELVFTPFEPPSPPAVRYTLRSWAAQTFPGMKRAYRGARALLTGPREA